MKRFKRLVALALAIFAMPAYAASAEQSRVIATIGNHPITQQEVDSRLKAQLTAIDSQIYDLRRKTIESMADDYLIEQAAGKAKLSVPDYMRREVMDKTPTPSEAAAKKFYDANKAQIKQPYEKVQPQVVAFLKQQEASEQREKLMDSLRAEEPLKIKLKAPRFQVASEGHPELGPKDAPVTIVEFGDFQCPFCKKSEDSIKQVRAKYADKVRLVYMDFPLSFHPNALPAAEAARCAGDQGKFWQFHDALFDAQPNLKSCRSQGRSREARTGPAEIRQLPRSKQVPKRGPQRSGAGRSPWAWTARRPSLSTAGRLPARSRPASSSRLSMRSCRLRRSGWPKPIRSGLSRGYATGIAGAWRD